jgi:hypothetical protein
MYKKLESNTSLGPWTTILRLSDNANIPTDPSNSDYQAYLKWLEEGGVPLPADE